MVMVPVIDEIFVDSSPIIEQNVLQRCVCVCVSEQKKENQKWEH